MKNQRGWALIAAAVLASGGLSVAQAQAQIDPAMTPLEVLTAKDAIRDKIALYSILSDGDGLKRDSRAWVDQMFTADAVFDAYFPNGKIGTHWVGREEIFRQFNLHVVPLDAPNATRHFPVQTVFDTLTPTTAETRGTAVILEASKNLVGEACAGKACGLEPRTTMIIVYHDSWVKMADGWKKRHTILRRDN